MPFDARQPAHQALRGIVTERTLPLVGWVGSGASAPAGVPTWPGLREALTEAAYRKAETLEPAARENQRRAVDRCAKEKDFWLAFELLQEVLGRTSYRDEVRKALERPNVSIPSVYDDLWGLRLRGMLTLNLDGFAARAFHARASGARLIERSGPEISKLQQVVSSSVPFVGNLHGFVEDVSSWVLTRPTLNELLKNEAYVRFISNCLGNHTVVFVGISADDLAVGGHLQAIASLGIEMPSHFWLTDRRDAETDAWAEDVGVRLIRYESAGDDHSAVAEFLRDLREAQPVEGEPPPPVVLRTPPPDKTLPPPEELIGLSTEDIRRVLNAHAAALTADGTPEAAERFREFAEKYEEPIHRASYVSTQAGRNELLGYTLEREIARGAFGRVFLGATADGERVAIKVLLDETRADTDLLQSFRRGVRSMRILSDSGVEGMVRYREASEIPAFVVMDYVEGPNLADAQAAGYLDDWWTTLRVARELTQIIRRAHALPERVLHRDIRPSNVMLKDYWTMEGQWHVVVLDFDLSWHRGAHEVSVLHTSSAGYLAPEQIRAIAGATTRSAAVDSFGLAMTLLFMRTGRDPLPSQHMLEDWPSSVHRACGTLKSPEWTSVPSRFARLVLAATKHDQTARIDLAEIDRELDRLWSALEHPETVTDPELLTDELAARIPAFNGYGWDEDALSAVKTLPTGLTLTLTANPQDERVELRIGWGATGVEDRQRVRKYVAPAVQAAAGRLGSNGWHKVRTKSGGLELSVEAWIPVDTVRGGLSRIAAHLDDTIDGLKFGG